MGAGIEFLTIYTEICLGTVAFMTIVATLKQTFGESLSAYQYLITRYFVDVGLIQFALALVGIGLLSFYGDEAAAWRIMGWLIVILMGFYIPYYIVKRSRIHAPWSLTPVVTTISAILFYANVVVSLLGLSSIPVPSAVTAFLICALISMVSIFLVFLGTFMKIDAA